MKLTGPGTAFELRITGYKFPEIRGNRYDSNWLMIEGQATHATGTWVFRHSGLLTFEMKELIDWLEGCAHNTVSDTIQTFLDPAIRFLLISRRDVPQIYGGPGMSGHLVVPVNTPGYHHVLRVYLDTVALPPWIPPEYTNERSFYCDFPVNETILLDAARCLRNQLAIFPQRIYLVD